MDKYIKNDSVDCIITDPPFWDLEKYEGPVNGTQLSDLSNKLKFDDMFKLIMKKSVNKLKVGGFMIVKIANFRKKGKFINMKDEWTQYIEEFGVDFIDEIILELSPVKRHPLYNQAITKMNMLKIHEYLIVFRKPVNNEMLIEHDNFINYNRPLVKNIYENENRLFWSKNRNKIDWITEKLKNEYSGNSKNSNLNEW